MGDRWLGGTRTKSARTKSGPLTSVEGQANDKPRLNHCQSHLFGLRPVPVNALNFYRSTATNLLTNSTKSRPMVVQMR